jgi:hypothetical protein
MRSFTLDTFILLLKDAPLKPRLKRELRFITSTTTIAPDDWQNLELVSITDRTGTNGILLIQPHDKLYVASYELSRGLTNKQTGRSQPVICDFCRTWQSGNNSASITFRFDGKSAHSVTLLCCADLACSNHVRTKTKESILSRAQLREDLDNEARVKRLRVRLEVLVDDLELKPLS